MLLSKILNNVQYKLNESFESPVLSRLTKNWKSIDLVFAPIILLDSNSMIDLNFSNSHNDEYWNVFCDDDTVGSYFWDGYPSVKAQPFFKIIGINFLIKLIDFIKEKKRFRFSVSELNEVLDRVYSDLFCVNKDYNFIEVFELLKSNLFNSGRSRWTTFNNNLVNYNILKHNKENTYKNKIQIDKISSENIKSFNVDDASAKNMSEYVKEFNIANKTNNDNPDSIFLVSVKEDNNSDIELPYFMTDKINFKPKWQIDEKGFKENYDLTLKQNNFGLIIDAVTFKRPFSDRQWWLNHYHKWFFDDSNFDESKDFFKQNYDLCKKSSNDSLLFFMGDKSSYQWENFFEYESDDHPVGVINSVYSKFCEKESKEVDYLVFVLSAILNDRELDNIMDYDYDNLKAEVFKNLEVIKRKIYLNGQFYNHKRFYKDLVAFFFNKLSIKRVQIDKPLYSLNPVHCYESWSPRILKRIKSNINNFYDIDVSSVKKDFSDRLENKQFYKDYFKQINFVQHDLTKLSKNNIHLLSTLNIDKNAYTEDAYRKIAAVYESAKEFIDLYKDKICSVNAELLNDFKKNLVDGLAKIKQLTIGGASGDRIYNNSPVYGGFSFKDSISMSQQYIDKILSRIIFYINYIDELLKMNAEKSLKQITKQDIKDAYHKILFNNNKEFRGLLNDLGGRSLFGSLDFQDYYPPFVLYGFQLASSLFEIDKFIERFKIKKFPFNVEDEDVGKLGKSFASWSELEKVYDDVFKWLRSTEHYWKWRMNDKLQLHW